jgi:hypothetical protein
MLCAIHLKKYFISHINEIFESFNNIHSLYLEKMKPTLIFCEGWLLRMILIYFIILVYYFLYATASKLYDIIYTSAGRGPKAVKRAER